MSSCAEASNPYHLISVKVRLFISCLRYPNQISDGMKMATQFLPENYVLDGDILFHMLLLCGPGQRGYPC
jgi:hypothetical protein